MLKIMEQLWENASDWKNPIVAVFAISLLWSAWAILGSGWGGLQGRSCQVNWFESPTALMRRAGCTARGLGEMVWGQENTDTQEDIVAP